MTMSRAACAKDRCCIFSISGQDGAKKTRMSKGRVSPSIKQIVCKKGIGL